MMRTSPLSKPIQAQTTPTTSNDSDHYRLHVRWALQIVQKAKDHWQRTKEKRQRDTEAETENSSIHRCVRVWIRLCSGQYRRALSSLWLFGVQGSGSEPAATRRTPMSAEHVVRKLPSSSLAGKLVRLIKINRWWYLLSSAISRRWRFRATPLATAKRCEIDELTRLRSALRSLRGRSAVSGTKKIRRWRQRENQFSGTNAAFLHCVGWLEAASCAGNGSSIRGVGFYLKVSFREGFSALKLYV